MKHSQVLLGKAWLAVTLGILGCSGPSSDTVDTIGLHSTSPLPVRSGTVLVDSCVLDTWQRATLARPTTRAVLQEVVMLCLIPRADGTVGPRDPSATAQLTQLIADLHQLGYRVNLGVAFTDETGQRFDGVQTAAFLADPAWRAQFRATLVPAIAMADGVEIDLEKLSNSVRQPVTDLLTELSPAVRPQKRLNVFIPPSVTSPSDLPDGDSFDLPALVPLVDRLRIMTLDYSDATPGPTIDPGWALDAVNHALASSSAVDIAYPLYGTDFGPGGVRLTTWTEALGVAASTGAPIQRGPTTAPFVGYTSAGGESHVIWFDDAESTGNALGAWGYDILPASVGVFYYGLGDEDPELFSELAQRQR